MTPHKIILVAKGIEVRDIYTELFLWGHHISSVDYWKIKNLSKGFNTADDWST